MTYERVLHYKVTILKNRTAIAAGAAAGHRAAVRSAKNFNVSLDNALEVFSLFLGQRHGLGISDLSRLTGMYKSRIFRIVKTFEKHDFLRFAPPHRSTNRMRG